MTPLVLGLGVPELLIILAVVLLLFGGARLAGIGKSTGRAIKEFKEETKGLKESDKDRSRTPGPRRPRWPRTRPTSSRRPAAAHRTAPPASLGATPDL